jgi:predicted ester cyclase
MNVIPTVLGTYREGLKARDVDKIAGTLADDLAVILPGRQLNMAQFLAMLGAIYSAFPDWHYEHEEAQVQGDMLAIRWRQGGTHTGTFALPGQPPVPATGKRVDIPWHYFFYRVRGNRIVEIRPEPVPGGAPPGILEQIGASLPPLF